MKPVKSRENPAADLVKLDWLAKVVETVHPIDEHRPIFLRQGTVRDGPAIPAPHRHPYCEISLALSGGGVEYVEGGKAEIRPGDLVLFGPGVPHWYEITRHPHRFITVYFLPGVIVGFGAGDDAMRVLQRVTVHQPVSRRVLRLPPGLRRSVEKHMTRMMTEFHSSELGSQLVLKAELYEMLVELLRWEQRKNPSLAHDAAGPIDLKPLQAAIEHIRAHYHQAIYAHQLAKSAGVDEATLKTLFHDVLRLSWVQYLQGYRVRQASLLLSAGSHNVTEAALSAGFESLSHFNATFRRILGVSPRQFLARHPPADADALRAP